jgi:hypothetical protein
VARAVVRMIAALGFLCAFADDPSTSIATGDAFVPLYNGKDLSGWQVREGQRTDWQANGEMLSCAAKDCGWLCTSKMYSDFILKIE